MGGDQPLRPEQWFEELLKHARAIVTVVDRHGVVRYVNQAPSWMLGTSPEDAVGKPSLSFVHPDDVPLAQERRAWLLEEPGRSGTSLMRVAAKEGWRHVETTSVNLLHHPVVRGLLYITVDVEEQVQQRAALARAVAGQQLVADLGVAALLGEDLDELVDAALTDVAALLEAPAVSLGDLPPEQAHLERQIGEVAALQRDSPLAVPLHSPAGRRGTLTAAARDEAYSGTDVDTLQGVANVLAGALLRAEREQRAVADALHDPLTGLATRPLLEERLERALARPGSRCALLLVDLDDFKVVNDSYGHAAGDEVLRALGPRLLSCVRPTDVVARYGGDEFVVLCEDPVDAAAVDHIAERIRHACAEPFALGPGVHLQLSGSVGVGWSSESVRTPRALVALADAWMYDAKRARQRGRT